jgi:hypothetical protein
MMPAMGTHETKKNVGFLGRMRLSSAKEHAAACRLLNLY